MPSYTVRPNINLLRPRQGYMYYHQSWLPIVLAAVHSLVGVQPQRGQGLSYELLLAIGLREVTTLYFVKTPLLYLSYLSFKRGCLFLSDTQVSSGRHLLSHWCQSSLVLVWPTTLVWHFETTMSKLWYVPCSLWPTLLVADPTAGSSTILTPLLLYRPLPHITVQQGLFKHLVTLSMTTDCMTSWQFS